MSEDGRPAGLDARIDAVLRDAVRGDVRGDGPPDLRARVMSRLRTEERAEPWFAMRPWPLAVGAAAVVIAVMGALLARRAPMPLPSPSATAVVVDRGPALPSPSAPGLVGIEPGTREPPLSGRARRPRGVDRPAWGANSVEDLAVERIHLAAVTEEEPPQAADIVLGELDLPAVDMGTSIPLTNP